MNAICEFHLALVNAIVISRIIASIKVMLVQ